MLRRLLQHFQQTVRRLFHKCGRSKNGKRALRFNWRPIIRHVNHLPHLANLICSCGGSEEQSAHPGVSGSGCASRACRFAQSFARLHSFARALPDGRIGNARAVRADAAKSGNPSDSVGWRQLTASPASAQRIFARSSGPARSQRMRKPLARCFAEVRDVCVLPRKS